MSLEQHSSVEKPGPGPPLLEGTRLHIKPDADVSQLFEEFNRRFFWGKLLYVEVRWSPRMTSCAGLCVYNRRPGYCSIRLSRPLLSLRSKVDLVETLIHEMIHAYLFVTNNNRDRDGHGTEFLSHMDRINEEVGLNILVYHTFNHEVSHYQQHVWLCNGPCQSCPPYFGKVHRSMNRAPGQTDYWWFDHEFQCGGEFTKIAEPVGYIPKLDKKRSTSGISSGKKDSSIKSKDIRSFFKSVSPHGYQDCGKEIRCQSANVSQYLNLSNDYQNQQTSNRSSTADSFGIESFKDINESTTVPSYRETSEVLEPVPQKSVVDDSAICSFSENTSSSESGEEDYFSIIASIFRVPSRKRKTKIPDPSMVKIRKPNLNAMPKSKQGTLKNLIKVPNQPTLDNFYKKEKSIIVSSKSVSTMRKSQRDTLKQSSVHSFFSK